MSKVYVIIRGFSDSNTHESDSKPIYACSSKYKADSMKKMLESSSVGCWYEVYEVDFDLL